MICPLIYLRKYVLPTNFSSVYKTCFMLYLLQWQRALYKTNNNEILCMPIIHISIEKITKTLNKILRIFYCFCVIVDSHCALYMLL